MGALARIAGASIAGAFAGAIPLPAALLRRGS
jgi:hypothetical protein